MRNFPSMLFPVVGFTAGAGVLIAFFSGGIPFLPAVALMAAAHTLAFLSEL